jgi:hypothetical protein
MNMIWFIVHVAIGIYRFRLGSPGAPGESGLPGMKGA